MPELSIIIPCLDDADRLTDLLPRLEDICDATGLDVETIIVDDASRDGSLGVAQEMQGGYPRLGIRVLHRFKPGLGYGTVLRYGIAHATGRFCIAVAADLSDPLHLMVEMIKRARQGAQLVQCSRYLRAEDRQSVSTLRRAYQSMFRAATAVAVGKTISDATFGFQLFDRVYVTSLGLSSNRFSVCAEVALKVILDGGRIEWVPGREGVRHSGHAKFLMRRELHGFVFVVLRAWAHRMGVLWF